MFKRAAEEQNGDSVFPEAKRLSGKSKASERGKEVKKLGEV